MLHGRNAEAAAIDLLLSDARSGRGRGLMLVGEAGIGKTALLEYAKNSADGFRVLQAIGVESEAVLPYAGLHALVRPLLPSLDQLPDVQASGLRGAFGLEPCESVDRFLVGNAVLALLSEAAEDQRVLCLVDDLQWFDSASADALLFAVRRLQVEQLAVILAVREWAPSTMRGVPELPVRPLDDDASREVLAEYGTGLSRADSARVLSEARGNPLALREMAGNFARQTAGSPHSYRSEYLPMPVPRRVEALFADRIAALPERTRRALLVAAADGTVGLTVFMRTLEALGASLADLAPAESDDLVHTAEGSVVFQHPLIRSAVYQNAPLHERIAVHHALAQALTDDNDNDRRAWHLATGTAGTDEHVATELVRTAENARRRGGYAAVSAAYERAAELTPDPSGRSDRMTLAARAAFVTGDRPWARRLVDRVEQQRLTPHARAFLTDLEAALIWHEDQQRALAISIDAASAVAPDSPDTAARVLFEAVVPDWAGGDAVSTADSAARLAALGLDCSETGRPFAAVVGALGRLAAGDPAGCVAALASVGEWLDWPTDDIPATDRVLDRTYRPYVALLLADLHGVWRTAAVAVDFCRVRGAAEGLPFALTTLAQAQWLTGRFREARGTASEALQWSDELGNVLDSARIKAEMVRLAAVAGDAEGCRSLADEAVAQGSKSTAAATSCHLGLLDLGLGRFEQARFHLESAVNGPAAHTLPVLFALPDLVEVAAALEDPALGMEAFDRYRSWTTATGHGWAQAIALRCQALLADEATAAELWERSLEIGPPTASPFEHARTELLYGSWLRRRRRSLDARSRLRSAATAFARMGATPWAERALTELRATGERIDHRPTANILDCLTPQELQVSRLAAKGLSNKEIAVHLFLSPRTVGYHLYKIFPKLQISTRTELASLIRDGDVVQSTD